MTSNTTTQALTGRRVLVPGGTGTVGRGVVRRYLAAGADVVVPTRTQHRADEFRRALGSGATEKLHLVVHDYTTFAGAEDLANQMESNLGGIDDVVASIGGWWAGASLSEIDEDDWQNAFVELATTHMAVLRACLPRMGGKGAYQIIVGESATFPVAGSGLVSMEQAALLMMQRVASVEADGHRRVFALVLGRVHDLPTTPGELSADQVGLVAVSASASDISAGSDLHLRDEDDVAHVLALLRP